MFVLSQEKLAELNQAQNQEFLYDLVYEIIKENPALKLNGQFDDLLEPVKSLMNQHLQKGINQINTLKYMVKSHVYLGIDYENDPYFAWIKTEMENYSIDEQVTYVDAFYEILEEYKKRVIGHDFEFLVGAIQKNKEVDSSLNVFNQMEYIYSEKFSFLNNKNSLKIENRDFGLNKFHIKDFVLGKCFKQNYFIKNIYN